MYDEDTCEICSWKSGVRLLRRGEKLRIGRHRDNDIVLPDLGVSRFHARIVWDPDDPNPQIYDSGSQNGTLVGEHRIGVCETQCSGTDCHERHTSLEHGVRVTIANSAFQIRIWRLGEPALLSQVDDTVALMFTDDRPDLRGEISPDSPLRELLLRLEIERRTGTLYMRLPLGEASVACRLGCITWAEIPQGSQQFALEKILRSSRGSFEFNPDLEPRANPMHLWISDFLSSRNGSPRTRKLRRVRDTSTP